MLTACTTSNSTVVERHLPPSPSWAVPSETTSPKSGEDLLIVAARERAAKAKANKTITEFRGWYEDVRQEYSGEKNEN